MKIWRNSSTIVAVRKSDEKQTHTEKTKKKKTKNRKRKEKSQLTRFTTVISADDFTAEEKR